MSCENLQTEYYSKMYNKTYKAENSPLELHIVDKKTNCSLV